MTASGLQECVVLGVLGGSPWKARAAGMTSVGDCGAWGVYYSVLPVQTASTQLPGYHLPLVRTLVLTALTRIEAKV